MLFYMFHSQATGVYTPSLISSALANMDLAQDISIQEDVMKGVAVTCYGGQDAHFIVVSFC